MYEGLESSNLRYFAVCHGLVWYVLSGVGEVLKCWSCKDWVMDQANIKTLNILYNACSSALY